MKYQNLISPIAPYTCFICLLFTFTGFSSYAQPFVQAKFGKGIQVVAQDSSFSMKFSTRFQTLYSGSFNTENENYDDRLLIRRARLKFDGFAYSPRLKYKIELGLTNSDIGGQKIQPTNNADNIILDAVLMWNFYKNFELWFGQTKLPGNRERVVSSQNLQFVDRSILNGYFNIDRDIGVQIRHNFKISNVVFREIVSVSMGEGRNVTINNSGGYDYTLRGEILPFGEFKNGGDYFNADLSREDSPKLSVGISYDLNKGASKEGGQLGGYLNGTRDLSTVFIDGMFKYKGNSVMFEYAQKNAPKGAIITTEIDDLILIQSFATGNGINVQYGYLFPNNIELSARYSKVMPEEEEYFNEEQEITFGISKYVVGHSLKVQSDLSLVQEENEENEIRFRLQVEMAL